MSAVPQPGALAGCGSMSLKHPWDMSSIRHVRVARNGAPMVLPGYAGHPESVQIIGLLDQPLVKNTAGILLGSSPPDRALRKTASAARPSVANASSSNASGAPLTRSVIAVTQSAIPTAGPAQQAAAAFAFGSTVMPVAGKKPNHATFNFAAGPAAAPTPASVGSAFGQLFGFGGANSPFGGSVGFGGVGGGLMGAAFQFAASGSTAAAPASLTLPVQLAERSAQPLTDQDEADHNDHDEADQAESDRESSDAAEEEGNGEEAAALPAGLLEDEATSTEGAGAADTELIEAVEESALEEQSAAAAAESAESASREYDKGSEQSMYAADDTRDDDSEQDGVTNGGDDAELASGKSVSHGLQSHEANVSHADTACFDDNGSQVDEEEFDGDSEDHDSEEEFEEGSVENAESDDEASEDAAEGDEHTSAEEDDAESIE